MGPSPNELAFHPCWHFGLPVTLGETLGLAQHLGRDVDAALGGEVDPHERVPVRAPRGEDVAVVPEDALGRPWSVVDFRVVLTTALQKNLSPSLATRSPSGRGSASRKAGPRFGCPWTPPCRPGKPLIRWEVAKEVPGISSIGPETALTCSLGV